MDRLSDEQLDELNCPAKGSVVVSRLRAAIAEAKAREGKR